MDFLAYLVGWVCLSPVTSRVSPRRASYFFSAKPKKSNQKKGEPRPCRFAVPCATRKMEHPRSGFAASPSRWGATPAARQSRFRGAPGRGCASRTSPRLLVRCAHLAGLGYLIPLPSLLTRARHAVPPRPGCSFAALTSRGWVTSFLYPHFSQGHGTPCHYTKPPHSSHLTSHHGQPQGLPLRPPSSLLRPHSYDLTPTTSLLTFGSYAVQAARCCLYSFNPSFFFGDSP